MSPVILLCVALMVAIAPTRVFGAVAAASIERPPNILMIFADDLGYAEVGCYGQTKIRTPNIDALAASGVRFTQGYSGSCVCAPSRCTLLTGLHTGHAAIRDNREVQPEGQEPLPEGTLTIASVLKTRGYATGLVGKWGLGPPGSSGDPSKQGFDFFFGYNCQRQAHNYCPTYLYRNSEKVMLERNVSGNAMGPVYAPDLFIEEAEKFVRGHKDAPFFLEFATTVPHVALQVPEDSLAEYRGKLEDAPYDGSKGYLKHDTPHAAYAAMVTRMDRDIGRLLALIDELGLRENTLVVFASDNGPTYAGGADSKFFDSAGGLRGLKGELYEGGIRVPFVVRWQGVTTAGSVSTTPIALWDLFPTFAAAAGADPTPGLDGIDLAPVLKGQTPAEFGTRALYWEYHASGGLQAVRLGDFKGVRRGAHKNPDGPIELYNLAADPGEKKNIAKEHPEIVKQIDAAMKSRTRSAIEGWNF